MNEIEFERTARHAAAGVRSQAERIADSTDALAALVASEGPLVDAPEPATVTVDPVPKPSRWSRRTPWVPILIAASTVAAVAGVVFLTTRDGDGSIVVTTEPDQPEPAQPEPESTEPTALEPDANEPDSDVGDGDGTPPAPTSAPLDTDREPADPFSFAVPDEIGQPLSRTVLLTADVGSGEFDLGWEDCQECDPLRPWGPVVDADGTIYIADVVNSRWRVVGLGVSRNVPFGDGEVVVGSPVIGPDGLLYAPVAAELGQTSPRRVVAYNPTTFEEIDSYSVGPSIHDRLELVNGLLQLGAVEVRTFDLPLGTPTVDSDDDARIVTISLSGTQREFQFPENWLINGRDAVPINDGSVVVPALADVDTDEWELVLVRLFLDGTTAAGTVDNDNTTNGAIQITSGGLVQLEGTSVVRYDLPGFAGNDPLAGWLAPPPADPDLNQVPRFLPQDTIAGDFTSVRTERVESSNERPEYSQTWVRADTDDRVDDIVQITTRLDPRLIGNPAVDVDVPGWERSYFSASGPDVAILDLHSATRSMTVWAVGVDQQAVLDATASLRVDDDGIGWATPGLPRPDDWTLVHEGWFTGIASRTLQQQPSDSSDLLEMWTVMGYPEAIGTPGLLWGEIMLATIDGRPALLFDDGTRSGVTWSPVDDVVVVFGSYGPPDELFEIADSVVEVDQATWEAASTLDTSPGDGCSSIFC